jgi:hypothetical protein
VVATKPIESRRPAPHEGTPCGAQPLGGGVVDHDDELVRRRHRLAAACRTIICARTPGIEPSCVTDVEPSAVRTFSRRPAKQNEPLYLPSAVVTSCQTGAASWRRSHPKIQRLNKISVSVGKVDFSMGPAPGRCGANFNPRGHDHRLAFTEVLCVAKIKKLVEVIELIDVVLPAVNRPRKRLPAAIDELKGIQRKVESHPGRL